MREKVSEASSNGCGGEGGRLGGPEDLTGAHPAMLEKKKKGGKKREGGGREEKKREKEKGSALLDEREASLGLSL